MAMAGGCSSSSSTATPVDAGGDGGRVIACPPPADIDAGAQKAAAAGVTAKILEPTNGQHFKSTDKVPLSGQGSAPDEPMIIDTTRTIWNVGDPVKGVFPDGEGPKDEGGPYAPGTYIVRFDVSSKACLTAYDSVTITVE